MAINSNRPVQPSGFDKNSVSDMNKVTKTAIEAVTDKIHDADGDQTSFKDVKKEFAKLSPEEKVAFSAATALTGGAAAMVSMIAEEGKELAQNLSEKISKNPESNDKKLQEASGKIKQAAQEIQKQVKQKYEHPPEEKIVEKLKDMMQDAGDALEEFADDVMDGRIGRDVNKTVTRFVRDNFTEQSKAEKFKNTIKDAAIDTKDAAADALDDIVDGRAARKIKHAID